MTIALTGLSLAIALPLGVLAAGVEWAGHVLCPPVLGGLHHQYARI
jgi:hypothetical protein